MNEQQQELARRAVACRHWRWMPGMLTHDGHRSARGFSDVLRRSQQLDTRLIPDLSDPATLGCLLALVREAWPDKVARICTLHYAIRWFIDLPNGEVVCCDTEAEALVAALEAAP
jgi:hypothetical protein